MPKIKWTEEAVLKEALKYESKTEFHSKSGSAYGVASKRGFLEKACSHMKESRNAPWNKEELHREALRYNTRGEFQDKSPNEYQISFRRKILDEICGHMKYLCYPWTDEELRQEALKYGTKQEFRKGSPEAYSVSRNRKITNDICSHMARQIRNKWAYEELAKEALAYSNRWEFQRMNLGAYKAAYKRGILDEICKHMTIGTNASTSELSLFEIIKTLYPKAKKLADRKGSIEGKPHIHGFDLDIYIPELRKGIEFDGKFHHSFSGLKRGRPHWPDEDIKNFHQLKDEWFAIKGIRVLHIKEIDWNVDQQACVHKCLEFLKI